MTKTSVPSIPPTFMELAARTGFVIRNDYINTEPHSRTLREVVHHTLGELDLMQGAGQGADVAWLTDHSHDFPGRMVMVNMPFGGPLGADGTPSSGSGYHRSKLFNRESVFELEIPGLLLASHRTESPISVTADLGVIHGADITVQLTSRVLKSSRGVLLALHTVWKFTVDTSGVARELRRWLNSLALGALNWSVGLLRRFATLLVVLFSGMIRIGNRLMAEEALHVINCIVLTCNKFSEHIADSQLVVAKMVDYYRDPPAQRGFIKAVS